MKLELYLFARSKFFVIKVSMNIQAQITAYGNNALIEVHYAE